MAWWPISLSICVSVAVADSPPWGGPPGPARTWPDVGEKEGRGGHGGAGTRPKRLPLRENYTRTSRVTGLRYIGRGAPLLHRQTSFGALPRMLSFPAKQQLPVGPLSLHCRALLLSPASRHSTSTPMADHGDTHGAGNSARPCPCLPIRLGKRVGHIMSLDSLPNSGGLVSQCFMLSSCHGPLVHCMPA